MLSSSCALRYCQITIIGSPRLFYCTINLSMVFNASKKILGNYLIDCIWYLFFVPINFRKLLNRLPPLLVFSSPAFFNTCCLLISVDRAQCFSFVYTSCCIPLSMDQLRCFLVRCWYHPFRKLPLYQLAMAHIRNIVYALIRHYSLPQLAAFNFFQSFDL